MPSKEFAPGLVIQGDPTLMRIAIENLVGNAWKYSSQSPTTRIEFRRDLSDRLNGLLSMGDMDDVNRIKPMPVGPCRPDTCDAGSGVDQHAIEVEEDCPAGEKAQA